MWGEKYFGRHAPRALKMYLYELGLTQLISVGV